jgi:DNA-binding winged helix-turn-helix (wHTH) protein
VPLEFIFEERLLGYSSIHFINQAAHITSAIDLMRTVLSGSKDLAENTLKKRGIRMSAKSQPISNTALQAEASLVCTV